VANAANVPNVTGVTVATGVNAVTVATGQDVPVVPVRATTRSPRRRGCRVLVSVAAVLAPATVPSVLTGPVARVLVVRALVGHGPTQG